MIIGCVLVYPNEEKTEEVHIGKPDILSYQIKLEGDFVIERTFTFFEPKPLSEILSYGMGYTGEVDLSSFNLNEMIFKSRTIHVKRIDHDLHEHITKININQASFKELLQIPGITETRAASLIIYREANGHFKTIDDLILVKNIGPVTLEKIRPYIEI